MMFKIRRPQNTKIKGVKDDFILSILFLNSAYIIASGKIKKKASPSLNIPGNSATTLLGSRPKASARINMVNNGINWIIVF